MKKIISLAFAMALVVPLFAVDVTVNSNAATNCQNMLVTFGTDVYYYTPSYPTSAQSTSINLGDFINIGFVGGGTIGATVPSCTGCGPTYVGTINCQGTNYDVYITIDLSGNIIIDVI